jgi:hypothetical protein
MATLEQPLFGDLLPGSYCNRANPRNEKVTAYFILTINFFIPNKVVIQRWF